MDRYLCIHGHFYQPPRENPWLEAIELQDSAYPYHDWNERITDECYRPNAHSRILEQDGCIARIVNNYSKISFNFGPTLLAWLAFKEPDVYEAILAADRLSMEHFDGHGSALAQAFNHAILPLCNARDRRTQVLWGLEDFRHRFGREPEGMWLPETAANTDTLEALAEHGVKFTILAPRQARRIRRIGQPEWEDLTKGIDPSRAYLAPLPSGRSMVLFFYDGPISQAVAFEGLLNSGELFADRLTSGFSDDRDEPVVRYHDRVLPIRPDTMELGGLDDLRALIDRQAWEPMHWRDGLSALNYRRFFDISDLVVLRVELEEVFEATHGLLQRLIEQGLVRGVRVDHVDGLLDPAGYLRRLDRLLNEATPRDRTVPYLVVEKILAPDEQLPADWPVEGTTGYDFMNQVHRLFVEPTGHRRLIEHTREHFGCHSSGETIRGAKSEVFINLFPAELERLTALLEVIASQVGGIGRGVLQRAIVDVTAALGVYRTYIRDDHVTEADAARIDDALTRVTALPAYQDKAAVAAARLLASVLRGDVSADIAGIAGEFVARWQRISGPVMAKGVEDTALYRFVALTSVCEVGGDVAPVDRPLEAFHQANRHRADAGAHPMLATATHDNKRGEDTRLRIDALSEMPEVWLEHLHRWMRRHASHRTMLEAGPAPDAADEWLFYQSALGIWPLDQSEATDLAERLASYALKAMREAKRRTSWYDPDDAYEDAVAGFIRGLLSDPGDGGFRREMSVLARRAGFAAALHSLSQVVLKTVSPGVADFYNGSELLDLALVDPDNRRPIDFGARRAALDAMARRFGDDPEALTAELRDRWIDGRIKLFVTWRCLQARLRHAAVFRDGAYLRLSVIGAQAERVVALARRRGPDWTIAVATRLTAPLTAGERWPLHRDVWGGTRVLLPDGAPRVWRDELSGRSVAIDGSELDVATAFDWLPAAVLSGAAPSSPDDGQT